MGVRYSLFLREFVRDVSQLCDYGPWDFFLSAYNAEERIDRVFTAVRATEKRSFNLPDYRANGDVIPESVISLSGVTEGDIVATMLSVNGIEPEAKVCVDATGIVRQYLPALMKHFVFSGH